MRRQRFALEWSAQPVRGVHNAFANVVADAGLRHTAATWLMRAGYVGSLRLSSG